MGKTVGELVAELAEKGMHLPEGYVRIGGFGDSEALSASLIALILTGVKRGTCSLVWSWDFDGEPIPKVGDMEIVLDWDGSPAFVLLVTEVQIVPFDRVGAEFAASEGEGDLSLAYWRTEHWRFFADECSRIGRVVDHSMPLVCESFKVLYTLTSVLPNE
ncbi:ASCH domain-containing protein [Paraburkholderia phytofirmans]|uniref:ASCH domain-containing protein n=1 Tax=Paraburkholderia phytofirmans TaxID=261302 RepID=UPI0038B80694